MGTPVSPNPGSTVFSSTRLERVFDQCFQTAEKTRLIGGADEPLYRPAKEPGGEHQLYYREDFFASALHEIAHWCIAGEQRRKHLDFGYWYAPEGRNPEQQRAFEGVEVKPQALEWYFSQACGYPFRVSVDNLDPVTGELPDTSDFRRAVEAQAQLWQCEGFPARAQQFFRALVEEFSTGVSQASIEFSADQAD